LREGDDWRQTGVRRNDGTWQDHAGWIKPAALGRGWLSQPGIQWRGGVRVSSLGEWRANLVVIAAAGGSQALLGDRVSVHPVRGQIAWGLQGNLQVPASPVNGDGYFVPSVPTDEGAAWFCGSTYGRGETDASIREEDTRANLQRLHALVPDVAQQLDGREVAAWAGVRWTSKDRRPLVGEIGPGIWLSTAMG